MNADLAHMSDAQLERHWLACGQHEGRRYQGPTRSEVILAGRGKTERGLEIAPYFRPIAPKASGYNVQIVDVFDRPTLLRRAADDPHIPDAMISRIEEVDFVGSAGQLRVLLGDAVPAGGLDYILSSHNFEHLPNPIQFLADAESLLAPTGVLSMAIPDLRCCFDFFQWPTMLEEWLFADLRASDQPSAFERFRSSCRQSNNFGFLSYPRDRIVLSGDLLSSYQQLVADVVAGEQADYRDAHCSFFTPASFRLLITELQYLGLTALEIVQMSGPIGDEFFVQLSPAAADATWLSPEDFGRLRQELLFDIIEEISLKSRQGLRPPASTAQN